MSSAPDPPGPVETARGFRRRIQERSYLVRFILALPENKSIVLGMETNTPTTENKMSNGLLVRGEVTKSGKVSNGNGNFCGVISELPCGNWSARATLWSGRGEYSSDPETVDSKYDAIVFVCSRSVW
tara:strand:- start:1036 stop:1416 length:381 start_codon:yes stop_codon:yes gene_type:complete